MDDNLPKGFSVRPWEAVNPSFRWEVIENFVITNGRGLALDRLRDAAGEARVDEVAKPQMLGASGVEGNRAGS